MKRILLLVMLLPALAVLQANVQISARQTTAFIFPSYYFSIWGVDQ